MNSRHPQRFYEGDKVCLSINPKLVGTFVMYCKGYRSHCLVQWPGDRPMARVKVDYLSLVERARV